MGTDPIFLNKRRRFLKLGAALAGIAAGAPLRAE